MDEYQSFLPKLTAIAVRLNRDYISLFNLSKGLLNFPEVGIKDFEGLHGFKSAPYVGYRHQLLPSEQFTAAMTDTRRTLCFGLT